MKKIVSLVLALVLVLAIAAPAMAITGSNNPDVTTASNNPDVTTASNAPFTDVDLVLVESAPTGLGVLSLQAIAANKAYVQNSIVNFALFYKTPSTAISFAAADYADPAAVFTSDIVTFIGATHYEVGTTSISARASGVVATGGKSMTVDLKPFVSGTSNVVVGSGIVSANVNGTIAAEIRGVAGSLKFAPITYVASEFNDIITDWSASSSNLKIYSGSALKYTVSAARNATDTDIVTYDVAIAATPGTSVQFVSSQTQTLAAGSTKNLSAIQVVVGANKYLVVDQGSVLAGGGTAGLKFYLGGVEQTDATLVAALTKAYSAVMTDFGFSYTSAGVLHPEHFARKASVFYAYDTAAITLYTGSVTVPDAGTDIPQTGDAATSIGFVMIALAIVAVAGVAYKKVRA